MLEHEVVLGHIDTLVDVDGSLSTRWKEKTPLAGTSS